MPCSNAATSVNILNADPDWRPVPPSPVARFTWDFSKSVLLTSALIAPVFVSIEAMAVSGCSGSGSQSWAVRSPAACSFGSSVVWIFRPPWKRVRSRSR